MQAANFNWQEFDSRPALAEVLASSIAEALSDAIAKRGQAIIALSGGSTPKPLFKALADCEIDWPSVVITLVDERWVPFDDELSNTAFLHEHLLSQLPEHPRLVSLFNISAAALSPALSRIPVLTEYCRQTGSTHAAPAAFDVVVLGMGGDGHTASFFPDAENVAELVDPNSSQYLLTCTSPNARVDRITWSLPMLLNTGTLILHITGPDKKQVFERAASGSDATELPIRSAIHQDKTELQVYYAE
ncbi:MAG: 6-phosphogluconolactonase [Gammaproteobacteria bacterium]|nr:6-phosphogluconolactonase [Gammaproteobacteria bacterium]